MDIKEELTKLCQIPAPSGFELEIAQYAVGLMQTYMDEAYVDKHGNAIGIKRCGIEHAPKLMLDAHLDQVGLMVTKIEEGFLRFRNIGGVDARLLPTQNVKVLTKEPLIGVVASVPPHLLAAKEQDEAIALADLWIDVGLTQEEAKKSIPIGTPIVYVSEIDSLQNDYLAGQAFDDRAGFISILRAMEIVQDEVLVADIYFVGSTKEEVGGSGATICAHALKPDYCIAVDVTHGKTPDSSDEESFPLGKGPAIGIGPNMNRRFTEMLMETAKRNEIEVQLEVLGGSSGTNAWHIQIAREGVATALISIPLKYMHSSREVIKLSDIEQTAKLLACCMSAFDEMAGDCNA